MLKEVVTLSNGVKLPIIGLGTWQSAPQEAYYATKFALDHGYLHVDTAVVYGNQKEVGQAVKDAAVARDQVFITTKIPAEWKTYEESKKAIDQSLEDLQVEVIDLMLIHAPRPWSEMHVRPIQNHYYEENLAMWRALEEAYQAGKIRAIGVSNFSIDDLEHLMEKATIMPMVNQVIYHIGRTDQDLLDYCKDKGIVVEAYSPIATGRLLGQTDIQAIADKYGKTLPQICIRYLIQKGLVVLPKSVHEDYIVQNAQVDFQISEEDMTYLDSL